MRGKATLAALPYPCANRGCPGRTEGTICCRCRERLDREARNPQVEVPNNPLISDRKRNGERMR